MEAQTSNKLQLMANSKKKKPGILGYFFTENKEINFIQISVTQSRYFE